MIDSGAATHVCPPWFAQNSPLYTRQQGQGPSLRTATDEERWRDQHVWIQMGSDGQQRQLQDSRTLLRVRRETTHHVSNSTDRRRVQHTVQRYTNNVTQQRLSLQLGKKSWILLPSSEAGQHSRQHETRHLHDWNNRISSNHTSDHYTNTNGSSQKQEWYMDIQLTRISGQNTQDNMQSTLRTRQQMSNTNRQTWELQKDHRLLTQWQQRRLWGQVSRSQKATTEKSPAWTNVDRRNVQQTTTATSSTISNIQGTRSNNDISVISTTAGDKTYIQETNWKHTTTTSASIYISNFDSTSQRCSTNIRLLGQRRQHVEKSTCPTTKGFVHTTTKRWWTRRYKTDATKKIHHQTHGWNKRTFSERWLDNKETSNTWQRMDRINKLWRTSTVQGRVHHRRHRWTTRSKKSKRHTSTTTTNRTRKNRTRAHTFAIQKLVSLVCTRQGQSRQPPKTTQQNTSDSSGHHLLQVHQRNKDNTSTDSSWHRNGHVYGSTNWRQNTSHAIPVNLLTTIPDGMRQNTSNTEQHSDTVRPRRLPESTTQDDSNSSWQHSSEAAPAYTSQSQGSVERFPRTLMGHFWNNQATAWKQLRHTSQPTRHALVGQTRSIPTQQVLSAFRWQHQLLQTLEQGAQNTNLWVWWNSSLHDANSKAQA